MKNQPLLKLIARKNSNKIKIAEKVISNTTLLPDLFSALQTTEPRIKYGANKILIIVSKKKPIVLYSKLEFFINQLDDENNFLKWGAIEIISNLCQVDSNHHFEAFFQKYISLIHGHHMITAANTIKALNRIANSKHNLIDKIAQEIMAVEDAEYETTECNNIVIGQAIKTLDDLFPKLKNKEPVFDFVNRQLKNKRIVTQKKAAAFIKKNKKIMKN